jgi:hypothetical protein
MVGYFASNWMQKSIGWNLDTLRSNVSILTLVGIIMFPNISLLLIWFQWNCSYVKKNCNACTFMQNKVSWQTVFKPSTVNCFSAALQFILEIWITNLIQWVQDNIWCSSNKFVIQNQHWSGDVNLFCFFRTYIFLKKNNCLIF